MVTCGRVQRASPPPHGRKLLGQGESPSALSPIQRFGIRLAHRCSGGLGAAAGISARPPCLDARPLARPDLATVSAADRAGDAGRQENPDPKAARPARDVRAALATSIWGSVRAPRKGIQRAPGIEAPESGPEGVGEAAGGLAVVELQQFCLGEGNGGGMPYPDGLCAVTGGVPRLRKAHGQKSTVRGYPLSACAHFGRRLLGH